MVRRGLALAWIGWLGARRAGARWWKENRRGRTIPATLGWAVAIGVWDRARGRPADRHRRGAGLPSRRAPRGGDRVPAGVVDDGFGAERGLRGHLRALVAGRLTTGSVKLAAAVLAAAIARIPARAPVGEPPRADRDRRLHERLERLDVAPGRALKGFLIVAVVLLVVDLRAFLLVCTGAACAVLTPDLRERGMLGDSGANLLGLAGAEIVRRLLEVWLVPAAPGRHRINVLAETVTFTRTVDAIPPLRWSGSPRTAAGRNFVSGTGGLVGPVC